LRWTGGALEEANLRAQRAERMAVLGQLAAGLAHEIRNPLGSIAGSVQLLKGGAGLSEEDRQLCDIIQREAMRLNDLVSDMTDLARPRRPEILPVDIAQTAREVVELTGRSGRAASDVDVRYDGPPSMYVLGDSGMLRQLIWNLVRNAVQASSAGELVRVELRKREDGRGELQVIDHGPGIDPQAKARIFDAFFTTRSHGTGVGLAVVKRIVDEHGFTIDVDSRENRGATFRVVLGPVQTDLVTL
jgi:two-component system sensor histidine kinase HydH